MKPLGAITLVVKEFVCLKITRVRIQSEHVAVFLFCFLLQDLKNQIPYSLAAMAGADHNIIQF
jgi:hypothetical protein